MSNIFGGGGNALQTAGAGNKATAGLAPQAGPQAGPQFNSPTGQGTNGLNAGFAQPQLGAADTAPMAPQAASPELAQSPSFWDDFTALMQEGGGEALADAGASLAGALEKRVSHVGGVSPYRGTVAPLESPGLLNLSNLATAMRGM